MLGRDVAEERGKPYRASSASSMSEQETELMGQATHCVRRFAPEGRKKMRRTDNGHITACKISDANPNEMIASWSGDHIYSFDLVRSPDDREESSKGSSTSIKESGKGRVRGSVDRKRKRQKQDSATSLEAGGKSPKPRHPDPRSNEENEFSLRVRYENGRSEDIAMDDALQSLPPSTNEQTRESLLTDPQKRSLRIAKSLVKIRKLLFSLEVSARRLNEDHSSDTTHHVPSFSAALGVAATSLPEMDEISRTWRYPVNPSDEDIVLQQTLRANRDSSRRFMQALGTVARTLGGNLQAASPIPSPGLEYFRDITPGPHEGTVELNQEIFPYDFLKAILLWLEGGPEALIQGFKRPPSQRKDKRRFPLSDDAQISSIDDVLIPYLLKLAGDKPILNIDASRFERDETRKVFDTETAAVIAFASAVKMPLEDLSRAIMPILGSQETVGAAFVQDRKTAFKYWGFKVGRGILMDAGEGVNFQFVDTAFGGLGTSRVEEDRIQEDVNPNEYEAVIDRVSLVRRSAEDSGEGQAASGDGRSMEGNSIGGGARASGAPSLSVQDTGSDVDIEDAGSEAEVILMDDLHDEIAEHMAVEDEDENDDDDDENEHENGESDADDDDGDGDITAEERAFMFRSASDRGKLREKVERGTPCYSHTRRYRGHCNVKTVKDANFFGLQDEYVVSGSDGGHLFIWDKKTSELINILEGDSEVVNVVQGEDSAVTLVPRL